MAKTIDPRLYSRPHLIDIVDEAWLKDKLPDDGED